MYFYEAEKRYRSLDNAYRNGRLSKQDYQAAVNQISVLDDSGRTWKIQSYTAQWHVFESGSWRAARPPLNKQLDEVQSENEDIQPVNRNWYLLRNEKKCGPYAWDRLVKVSEKSGLHPSDKVWTETWPGWINVSDVTELEPYINQPVVNKKPSKKGRKTTLLIAAVVMTLCVSVIVVFSGFFTLLLFGSQAPASGKLSLGDMQVITVSYVGLHGDQIIINNAASELDGMTIEVPEGAYRGELNLSVGETQILSHTYGEDFEPASPLITIDNGQVFAHEPLILAIPIQKTDDEFAMGFYYDRQTGDLEGIPFISQSNKEIVLYTAHFSDIVISKVQKVQISHEIDTGFAPGIDDFQMPNYGSYISPRGHCGGQSIAAMYYFNNIKSHGELRVSQQVPLWGRFDNETHITGEEITPDLFWDDSSVLRLSSALQYHMVNRWINVYESPIRIDTPEHELFTYGNHLAKNDLMTYYAFAYTMQVTRKPQFVYIAQSRKIVKEGAVPGAHAMIAYKISGNSIYVADPNFRGNADKFIELDWTGGQAPAFKPYNSGLNASDTSLLFDRFGYYGVSALVDESVVAHYWREVINGSVVAQKLFPGDVQIEVAVDRDDDGNVIFSDLVDDLVLTKDGIARVDSQGSVYLRIKEPDPADRIRVYFGTEYENYFDDSFIWLNLSEGINDIGIGHFRLPSANSQHFAFVNFRRYSVSIASTIEEQQPAQDFETGIYFHAPKIMSAALEQMGYEFGTDYSYCWNQDYCFWSSDDDLTIEIKEGRRQFDPQSVIDRYLDFLIMPTQSTYRGYEAWTYRAIRGYLPDLSAEYLLILGPEWHFEIIEYLDCPLEEDDFQCDPGEPRNLFPIVDAILESAAQLEMIELHE